MTQIRLDPVTREPVIMAGGRGARPMDLPNSSVYLKAEESCPFCPGNEDHTPPEIDSLSRNGAWVTRTFTNKFPVCDEEEYELVKEDGLFLELHQTGIHQVIIDNPDHKKNFFNMMQTEMEDLLNTYQRRMSELSKDLTLEYILLFKNYRKQGGASLYHPHTQIIGTPFIPPLLKRELSGYQDYYRNTGKCVYCEMIARELGCEREVIVSKNFLVLAPFASRFPYETWVLPVNHQANFVNLQPDEVIELAAIVSDLFGKYFAVLGNFPYNLYLHNISNRDAGFTDYHWHLEIVPRLSTLAGFEIGGGSMVNTVLPEDASIRLKGGGIRE